MSRKAISPNIGLRGAYRRAQHGDRHGLTGDRVNEPLDRQERRQRRIRHGPHRSGARRGRDRVHSGTTLIGRHEVLAAFAEQHLGDPRAHAPAATRRGQQWEKTPRPLTRRSRPLRNAIVSQTTTRKFSLDFPGT